MVYVYYYDTQDESKNIGIPDFRLVDGYNMQFVNISKDQAQDILNNLDYESYVRISAIADELTKILGIEIDRNTKSIPVKTDEELISNQYLEARINDKYNPEEDSLEDKYLFYITHYYNDDNPSSVQPYIE